MDGSQIMTLSPISAAGLSAFGGQALAMSSMLSTTVYIADPQFEAPRTRSFVDNPLVDRFIPSAERNLTSTVTAPVFVDTLLHHVGQAYNPQSLQVLGDVPDTPCRTELTYFEKVLERHPTPVDGYDRGNHSSANAYGVVNLRSRFYRGLIRFLRAVRLIKQDPIREDIYKACGGEQNFLTPKATLEGMHRILHRHHTNFPKIEEVNTAVRKANARSYTLWGSSQAIPFGEVTSRQTFETFWKPTAEADGRTRYWETVVNDQVADLPLDESGTKVTPFYVQAAESKRFRLEDGTEVPVYTISMDSLDNGSPLAVVPGVSALQVRLVENFIEAKLKENSNARFKLSSHFSSILIMNGATSSAARKLLRRLLSREEIVLFTGGHSHQRERTDLKDRFKLDRKTPLWECIVPSLIDFHPSHNLKARVFEDARSVMIETMTVDRDAQGRPVLKIDLEYKGLDHEDFKADFMPEVEAELARFKREHGYQRSEETIKDLRNKHIKGYLLRRLRHLGELANPFRLKRFLKAWGRLFSPIESTIDNFTVVSAVQMFNECSHFIPFLKSVIHFMKMDEPGEMAARAQIEGVLQALETKYPVRRREFEEKVSAGASSVELKTYADLYERAGLYLLPELFLQLKMGGRARAFAVLAGLDASHEEYEWHHGKPTTVPNKPPTISIPLGVT